MAKAIITTTCPKCGATHTVKTDKRNSREAEAWEAWAAEREWLCPECLAKAKAEARAAESAKASEAAAIVETPALNGSDKQVAWAADIRAKAIAEVLSMVKPEGRPAVAASLAAVLATLTEARWWIDHRVATVYAINDAAKAAAENA